MIKYFNLIIFFAVILSSQGIGQTGNDGSYLWNNSSVSYSLNAKTEFVLSNKDHYNLQTDRLDYFHFDLAGYRKLSDKFLLGLGLRVNDTYKSATWNPGGACMFYGVWFLNPGNVKIKFANRVAVRAFKASETQYTFDNITNIDFFTHSAGKFPKPYFMDEIFTNMGNKKVQTIRLYGGLHLLKLKSIGVDLYYCYHKTRPLWVWKEFNVYGLSTKFRI